MALLRSILAIVLLAAFALPFALSSLALGQTAGTGLPACCRRTGAHHCGMTGMADRAGSSQQQGWEALPMRCPFCPATPANAHLAPILLSSARAALPPQEGVRAAVYRAECAHRLARERARHKRGPPAVRMFQTRM